MIARFYILFLLLFLSSCSWSPHTAAYKEQYVHLQSPIKPSTSLTTSPYFIVFLVHAPHLDYSNNISFLRTMAKHPSDCSKSGNVGHSWIYLHGIQQGQCCVLEGGHSGELGLIQPKYFEGVMNLMNYGSLDPCMEMEFEANPVKYLWDIQKDGFFQTGNGGHCPNFAAKVNLTEEQFHKILRFIDCYNYEEYSLVGNQCASFVAQIAAMIGLPLECDVTFGIESDLVLGDEQLHFWNDPCYSEITISSPDILEKSLRRSVLDGEAEYALPWYLRYHAPSRWEERWKSVQCFPMRFQRYCQFSG